MYKNASAENKRFCKIFDYVDDQQAFCGHPEIKLLPSFSKYFPSYEIV